MTGTNIGRYDLLTEIASGGMATVYAARVTGAQGFEKLVAVKRMLPAISSDGECRNMFIDEGRLAAHIRSSYVVSTFDLQEHEDGSLYLVMDLVIGASLASILTGSAGAPLPIPVVAQVVQHAARGLHDAHEACSPLGQPLRIVHRDVSPQNILVGLDGATRITDFGIAHAEERLAKTGAHELKGKMAYFSPEQAQGEFVDGRSDLFSLGIVLWETLTQRRLFRGAEVSETLSAVLGAPISDPRTFRPEISPQLAAVVMRALERAPERRYQTGLQFAEALISAVTPAGVADTQAMVRQHAGESVGQLVRAIHEAIQNADPSGHTTEVELPAIARDTLATTAMKQVDMAQLLQTRGVPSTGPMLAFETGPLWTAAPPVHSAPIHAPAAHGTPAHAPSAHAPSAHAAPTRPSRKHVLDEEPTEWHGESSAHVPDPRVETRNKVLIMGASIVLIAITVGGLVTVYEQDAEAAVAPPLGFAPADEIPVPQQAMPPMPPMPPGQLPRYAPGDSAEELAAAIVAEAEAATRAIEEIGHGPLPEEPDYHHESDTVQESRLQVVCGASNSVDRILPEEVAWIEEQIRAIRCAPEAHNLILVYNAGELDGVRYDDSVPHSECFHEGVTNAAAHMPRPVSGALICRTRL